MKIPRFNSSLLKSVSTRVSHFPIKDYWDKFLPIDSNWYVFISVIYGAIGILGIILNVLVLVYLIK